MYKVTTYSYGQAKPVSVVFKSIDGAAHFISTEHIRNAELGLKPSDYTIELSEVE